MKIITLPEFLKNLKLAYSTIDKELLTQAYFKSIDGDLIPINSVKVDANHSILLCEKHYFNQEKNHTETISSIIKELELILSSDKAFEDKPVFFNYKDNSSISISKCSDFEHNSIHIQHAS